MPTFLTIKAGQVVDTLKGADPAGLTRMITTHRGPNPPVAPLSPEAEAAKSTANDLFKSGKYDEALEAYTQAIELAPESFTLLGNRSLTHLKLPEPNPAAALEDAQKAVELAPTWGKGWVRVGEALSALGQDKEAVEAFEKAGKNSEGTVQKGELSVAQGGAVRGRADRWASLGGKQRRSRNWRRPKANSGGISLCPKRTFSITCWLVPCCANSACLSVGQFGGLRTPPAGAGTG